MTRRRAQSAVNRESQRRRAVVDEALRPWIDYDLTVGQSPSFYGQTARDWIDGEREMIGDLADRLHGTRRINQNSRQIQDLVKRTAAEWGISEREALENVYQAFRDGPDAYSFAMKMGLPSAAADEKLGIGALQLSGIQDAGALNAGMKHATDLQGTFNGNTVNIDSQKQLTPSNLVSIGGLQNVENARHILRMLDDDMSVLQALQQIQKQSRLASGDSGLMARDAFGNWINVSGAEDKLMQSSTSRFNPSPSRGYAQNEELMRKDGLLISDRGGYQPEFDEFYGKGPFDSEKPKNLILADMESLRDTLSNTRLGDFRGRIDTAPITDRGGLMRQARGRNHTLNDVKVQVPKSILRRTEPITVPRLAGDALLYLTDNVS